MKTSKAALFLTLICTGLLAAETPSGNWQTYKGESGPGHGKRIVLITGDEEYGSEEELPQLAKILATRHGFDCTVLFSQDPAAPGIVNPNYTANIPGLDQLATADLMIIFTRFRDLPDSQMQPIKAYLESGRPVIGLRTATHAFRFPADSPWAHWSSDYKGDLTAWHGGFGQLVLGTTWISHHASHKNESTRGIIRDKHPITRGIASGEIWSHTNVYHVKLPADANVVPLVFGQVLVGKNPTDAPVGPGPYKTYVPKQFRDDPTFNKNDPMMPIAWTKTYQLPDGKPGKAFATTLGCSLDPSNPGIRRLLVQAVYWSLELPIPANGVNADLVGDFSPSMYGFHPEPGYWPGRALRATNSPAPNGR